MNNAILLKSLVTVTALYLGAVGSALAEEGNTPGQETTRKVQESRFGVATHFHHGWDCETVMPLIVDAGLAWIRDDIYWGEVEETKGVYKIPDRHLRWIKMAHARGLKLILILNGENRLYQDIYDPDAYARWAAEMATQLKDDVDCLEILNEPANFGYTKAYGGMWNGVEKDGSVSPWVGKYVTLINKAAVAIKAANPKMKVIGLGSQSPVNFRQVAMGIDPAVDGMVDHPYSFRVVPEIIPFGSSPAMLARDGIVVADEQGSFASLIRNYRAQSKKYNGPKEIWLTEWGYTTFQPSTPMQYAGFTPNAQAKYLLRRFVECLGLGVEVSIQYDFKDDGTDIRNPEHFFGMVDVNLRPKPAYEAISNLTQATAALRADAAVKVNVFPAADRPDVWPIVWDKHKLAAPGTIPTYGFRDAEGRVVVAIWSAERADGDMTSRVADVELVVDHPVTEIRCLNVLSGKHSKVAFHQEDGTIMMETLTIPDSPIFLTLE
jgi:hypothetical protein